MAEEFVTEKEKKGSLIGSLFRLAVFAMTVYGMYTAAKKVTAQLARRLEEDNEGSEEKRFFTCLRSRYIYPEESSELDVTTVASCVEVDLCGMELPDEMSVKLRTFGGQVVVKVPTMVRVEVTGRGRVCSLSSMVPNYENPDLPVIYVDADSMVANVKIEIGEE